MKYTTILRNKFLAREATNMVDIIEDTTQRLLLLRQWNKAGVTYLGGAEDDHALFGTDDPDVASKFGFDLDQEDLTG